MVAAHGGCGYSVTMLTMDGGGQVEVFIGGVKGDRRALDQDVPSNLTIWYKTKTIPSKFTYTPTYDTSELIVTARQRQMTSSGESIGRANGIATNRSNRSNRKQRNFTSIRSAVGFNFNHEDRQKLKSLNDAKLSRLHKYNDRIETNVVRPTRFAEIEQSDQRVHHLIRQRVDYYTKLQSRFQRDRAMQLAAGV